MSCFRRGLIPTCLSAVSMPDWQTDREYTKTFLRAWYHTNQPTYTKQQTDSPNIVMLHHVALCLQKCKVWHYHTSKLEHTIPQWQSVVEPISSRSGRKPLQNEWCPQRFELPLQYWSCPHHLQAGDVRCCCGHSALQLQDQRNCLSSSRTWAGKRWPWIGHSNHSIVGCIHCGRGGHTAALPLPDLHGNKIKLWRQYMHTCTD